MTIGWMSAVAAVAIMAIGSALQAAVGIGLALFVVPVLALIDPAYIPGPMLSAGIVLAAMTAWRERHALDPAGFSLSLAGLLVGTVVGAAALKVLQGPALPKVFGVLILLAVLLSIFGPPLKVTGRSLSVAGTAAGIMGTMVGIHGPPIALVFQNAEPAIARAMLGAFFTAAYFGSVVGRWAVRLARADTRCDSAARGRIRARCFTAHRSPHQSKSAQMGDLGSLVCFRSGIARTVTAPPFTFLLTAIVGPRERVWELWAL